MQDRQETKIRRLTVWFCINLVIFIACYLNYLLQLKHRYLYRILNVGLCLSRAAAMVINFNLLLVWLPMCKYSLTRLSCLASQSLKYQREQYLLNLTLNQSAQAIDAVNSLQVAEKGNFKEKLIKRLANKFKVAAQGAIFQFRLWLSLVKMNSFTCFLVAVDNCKSLHTICATTITIASVIHTIAHLINVVNFSRNFDPLLNNLNMAEYKGQNPFQLLISVPGITGLLMMFILILMSLSSVDYIRNSCYDLFQIFHRLSIIFVLLLVLHPSSHVIKEQSNVERHNPKLCYSQIVANHSLSNLHLLRQSFPEESKVFKNELIHSSEIRDLQSTTTTGRQWHSSNAGLNVNASLSIDLISDRTRRLNNQTTRSKVIELRKRQPLQVATHNFTLGSRLGDIANQRPKQQERLLAKRDLDERMKVVDNRLGTTSARKITTTTTATTSDSDCLDSDPLFVAQSSVCWYVLSVGLSCYVLDLLLRKLRRSKSSIELLDVRLDGEDNLIELILNSNHRRFSHWQPGQFVYLNCPQIATYEWHPFTISSMDNRSGQFTLHIKTSGDWTRKLRQRLECALSKWQTNDNSMSSVDYFVTNIEGSVEQQVDSRSSKSWRSTGNLLCASNLLEINSTTNTEQTLTNVKPSSLISYSAYCKKQKIHEPILPDLNCYNKMGQLQIRCIKLIPINHEHDYDYNNEFAYHLHEHQHQLEHQNQNQQTPANNQELYSISHDSNSNNNDYNNQQAKTLDLFIDGPFHSPFERLLEQQVSVCIANGVGWTAFSSVFQSITNEFTAFHSAKEPTDKRESFWSHHHHHHGNIPSFSTSITTHHSTITSNEILPELSYRIRKLSDTKLHLMVIVTSVEQLKPFYNLACDYFNQIQDEHKLKVGDRLNPVKEITAFLTRSTKEDDKVKEFCRQENLSILMEDSIRVNDIFTIQFGKPKFDIYLNTFSAIYQNNSKISVYCCGSFQVKKEVREVCQNLNRVARLNAKLTNQKYPFYSYHEENF